MARAVSDRYPAMAGSAALHAIILISGLIAWPWLSKPLHMGDVVPVTLITSNEAPASKPAIQAPEPAPAATEAPVPQASPQVAAPEETPAPAPPVPKPAPQPVPKPHQAQPAKVTPAPTPTPHKAASKPAAQPAPELNMAALSAELTKQARPSGPRQPSAARGPSRPEQAIVARTSVGASEANFTAAQASLSAELNRIWNPICNNSNASNIVVKVTFKIGSSGILIGDPRSSLAETTDNALRVASDRAVRSVYQHGTFADPAYRVLYGQNITVNFQKKDCSNR